MQVKISQAIRMVTLALKAGLVPMIEGSPAIGKSSIVHQIAKHRNLKVIDLRLSQCDPTDLLGFPTVNPVTKRAHYAPMDTFPIKGDSPPEGYKGWLLFLDEFTSASKAVQAAAYKIILDRMVGLLELHQHVYIVCAGNKDTDGAIVEEMSTALQSRLVHMELIVDKDEWIDWATKGNVDYHITSYIQWKPGMLYNFRPDHTDKTYAAPRTWEFADRIIKANDNNLQDQDIRALLSGTVSEGVAYEFLEFCKIFNELPKLEDILSMPGAVPVSSEPSILFALCGSLAHNTNNTNVSELMKYVKRMQVEFQVIYLKEIVRRDNTIMENPAVVDWVTKSAKVLF